MDMINTIVRNTVAVRNTKQLKEFFKDTGIKVFKKYTQDNILVLRKTNGEQVEIWAEIDGFSNLPYIFIEEIRK